MFADQWRDVEFGLCIEPAIGLGHLLTEQPVGADQLAIGQNNGLVIGQVRALDDDEVIAKRIEAVAVDALQGGFRSRPGMQLLVEHAVAQALAGFDLARVARLAQDQSASLDVNVRPVLQDCSPAAVLPQTGKV